MNSNSPNRGEINPTNNMEYSNNNAVTYICGSCGNDIELKPKDNIVCKECNGRIFYKKRTKKLVQFEAR